MVTRLATKLVLLLSFVALYGCASQPEEPIAVDPDGFALGVAAFESAYDEMDSAIYATPEWQTRPRFAARVKGLAELALHRAELLRPYVAQGLISAAAIDLMKQQTSVRAMLDDDGLPKQGGTHLEGANSQLTSFAEEVAYHRTWRRIETLEMFALEPKSTPWLDHVVITKVVSDLETVVRTAPETAASWSRINVSSANFTEDSTRAKALLDRLKQHLAEETN